MVKYFKLTKNTCKFTYFRWYLWSITRHRLSGFRSVCMMRAFRCKKSKLLKNSLSKTLTISIGSPTPWTCLTHLSKFGPTRTKTAAWWDPLGPSIIKSSTRVNRDSNFCSGSAAAIIFPIWSSFLASLSNLGPDFATWKIYHI